MTRARKFPNQPVAVRAARRFAVDALAAYPPEVLEVVELLVSELAGNCVRHTDSPFEVRVDAAPQRIRVTVSDRAGGKPVVQSLDPSAVRGRGLALVEMLSGSWGVRHHRLRGGKSVWFTLEIEDQRRGSREVA